ncbi:MAG TPA: aminotransferase class I/II-fold pyridoxal phosphate-dependent enzyme, partial [Candidatus Paceibacterota bacterium]
MIPYSTQDINETDIKAVVAVLRSGWLTQGPALERFEKAIAKKVGAKFAVAFNSGTAALHAAYFAAGVGKGDEVIVPALTFAATA